MTVPLRIQGGNYRRSIYTDKVFKNLLPNIYEKLVAHNNLLIKIEKSYLQQFSQNLFGNIIFADSPVKIRLLGWTLFQYDC